MVDELKTAANLKWLQITCAGANMYTHSNIFPKHVVLTNASGAFGKIIFEYVVGAILMIYRNFNKYWEQQRSSVWLDVRSERTLHGKNILGLGMGDVGSNIAKKLSVFDCHIIGIKKDISKKPNYFNDIIPLKEIDKALPGMDIVISALPNTRETKGILDYQTLSQMKPNATLINVGRGATIVTNELIRILKERNNFSAVIDVVDTELLPKQSELWHLSNVFITPHISGKSFHHSKETELVVWNNCIENLKRYLNGVELNHIVNLEYGY